MSAYAAKHHHRHHDRDDDDDDDGYVVEKHHEVEVTVGQRPVWTDREQATVYEEGDSPDYRRETVIPKGRTLTPAEAERVEREDARAGAEADQRRARERREAGVAIERQRTGRIRGEASSNDALSGSIESYPEVEIKNLSKDGDIWVGGEPTNKGYRQVHELGVTAIVDLRNPTKVQRSSADEARRLKMDYINLPIQPRDMSAREADRFLAFMDKHQGEQVLIHCGSANRASGMYAVYLAMRRGLSPDDAIRRARRTGLQQAQLEQDVRGYLADHESQRLEYNRRLGESTQGDGASREGTPLRNDEGATQQRSTIPPSSGSIRDQLPQGEIQGGAITPDNSQSR
jgi:protein tyrosine phosphatase (PTP) superfamily phosphohydrolase (DUF442 family)